MLKGINNKKKFKSDEVNIYICICREPLLGKKKLIFLAKKCTYTVQMYMTRVETLTMIRQVIITKDKSKALDTH